MKLNTIYFEHDVYGEVYTLRFTKAFVDKIPNSIIDCSKYIICLHSSFCGNYSYFAIHRCFHVQYWVPVPDFQPPHSSIHLGNGTGLVLRASWGHKNQQFPQIIVPKFRHYRYLLCRQWLVLPVRQCFQYVDCSFVHQCTDKRRDLHNTYLKIESI